ncbi:MAG: CHC2 zinc finger domain-containing protein [Planctomycetota bacterium]|jgi:DNA primase
MGNQFEDGFLRKLRNDIAVAHLIENVLKIPCKYSEGYFRFLCPICHEFNTSVKQQTNLARCFRCKRNFNPIDMVMVVNDLSFIETVRFLKPLLDHTKNIN